MKVLWYVNVPLPRAAAHFGFAVPNGGGWLVGQADFVAQSGVELSILHATPLVKAPVQAKLADGITYLFLPAAAGAADFGAAIRQAGPDLVHVFGTEYGYNLDVIRACRQLGVKYVVSIQGIMTACAEHYMDGLPARFARVDPLVRLMKKLYYADSIALARQDFAARAAGEREVLKDCPAVIGRTAWDKAYVVRIAPRARYYTVNENLRDAFYTGERWQADKARPHTIFVSQAFYPIKGFHRLLAILPALLRRYPDLQVRVAGQAAYSLGNPVLDWCVDRFFEYQRYIKQQIRKEKLGGHIRFLGPLCAEQMKQEYLSASLFLSPSTVENSPNSVGEAMMLGVPVAASNVGGTGTLLGPGEGILYDFADLDGMQAAICRLLDEPDTAAAFGAAAHAHAAKTHDRAANTQALLGVYRALTEETAS